MATLGEGDESHGLACCSFMVKKGAIDPSVSCVLGPHADASLVRGLYVWERSSVLEQRGERGRRQRFLESAQCRHYVGTNKPHRKGEMWPGRGWSPRRAGDEG